MIRVKQRLQNYALFPPQLWVILSGFFFVNCGANMVIPFFGIYLTHYMDLSAAQAGLVLTVTVGTPRAMALFGGSFSDRFGIRRSMLLGLFILICSAVGYAFSDSVWSFILNSFISGIGYSLFTPAGKAAVSAFTPEKQRVLAFSLRNMAVNIGVAVGPIIGMWITIEALRVTFLLTAVVYMIFWVLVWKYLRTSSHPGQQRKPSVAKNLLLVFRDRRLIVFSLLIVTFYIMLAQFSLVLPLYAADKFGAQDQIGMLFTGNAVLMIVLQYPVLAVLSRYLKPTRIALTGVALTATGLGTAGFAGNFSFLVVTLVVFTMGQLLIMPSIDTVVANYAPDGLGASYQGFSGLAGAVGGIAGNALGGILYGWARGHQWLTEIWAVYFCFGMFICIFFLIVERIATGYDKKAVIDREGYFDESRGDSIA